MIEARTPNSSKTLLLFNNMDNMRNGIAGYRNGYEIPVISLLKKLRT
jgi:hypothetical protein